MRSFFSKVMFVAAALSCGRSEFEIDAGLLSSNCVFHVISITDSTASRSPIPREADH